ncbi:MAG: 50S ribosomal protein L29 [Candidatus Paceibacterota bacterium]|jgi:ribosomal protein L29
MAKAKTTKDLKTESMANLAKLVSEKQEALRVFRFGVAGSKVKNVKEGDKLRKSIARVLTEINLRKKGGRDN